MPLLEVKGLTKRFGGLVALNDVNLTINEGETHGIIGPNGAGKTTLFNVITGEFKPTTGTVVIKGDDITRLTPNTICKKGVSRTFQLTRIFPDLTVYESIWLGSNTRTKFPWDPFSRADHLEEVAEKTFAICQMVGLHDKKDTLAVNLSYGDQKVLEIAMALGIEPSILFLDEPTQGVSPKETEMIIEVVEQLSNKMTIVLIEHSIDVVLRLCNVVTVLSSGEVIANGTPQEIKDNAEVQRVYLGVEV